MSTKKRPSLSRRDFLQKTGIAVGAATLGSACGGDDDGASEGSGGANAGGSSGSSAGTGGAPSSGAGGASGSSGAPTSGSGGSTAAGGTAGGSSSSGGNGGTPTGSGGAPSQGGGDGGGGNSPGDSGPPADGNIVVSVVKMSDLDAAVAKAVELAGGIEEIQAGQTVFIKPNAVSDRAVGTMAIRTNPEVLASVVRLVKQRNPGRITVGDRSARSFPNTAQVFEATGLGQAALDAGADEIFPAQSPAQAPEEWVLLQPPRFEETWDAAGGVYAMKRIIEADHLINVPTCKNHQFALFSLAMKNFIGAIGDSSRDPLHYLDSFGSDFDPLSRDIALLNQLFSPLISIIDATTVLVNGGPGGDGANSVRTEPGLIFASKDRVALDAAAVSLIKLELGRTDVASPDRSQSVLRDTPAWELPQIAHAVDIALGALGPDGVTLAFHEVPDSADIEAIFRA